MSKSKCEDLIATSQKVGDNLVIEFEKDKDIKVVQTALSAFKTAVSASRAQLIYKKLTGKPSKMDFFE